MNEADEARGVGTGAVEVATSLVLAVLGAVAMWDSRRIGAGWAEDGPQSGTFPFWIGLILVAASLGTLVQAARSAPDGPKLFVSWPQLRLVLSVLVPTIIYVVAINFLGLYVASALFIGFFMWRLGGYRGALVPAVAILVPLALFMMFEVWFRVPLPKGPLEAALGF